MTRLSRAHLAAALAAICALAAPRGLESQDAMLRVSETEARKAVIKKIEPEYPAMARQIRISGQVQVDVVIGVSGNVESIKVLKGNALLSSSAVTALKKWKFTPFLGAGNKPARAITSLTFDFRLGA